MKALLQTGSSGRVPVPPEKRFLINYPDDGCNAEFFTMPGFLEIESLGALAVVNPGDYTQLNECWSIHDIDLSEDEGEIDNQLKGVI